MQGIKNTHFIAVVLWTKWLLYSILRYKKWDKMHSIHKSKEFFFAFSSQNTMWSPGMHQVSLSWHCIQRQSLPVFSPNTQGQPFSSCDAHDFQCSHRFILIQKVCLQVTLAPFWYFHLSANGPNQSEWDLEIVTHLPTRADYYSLTNFVAHIEPVCLCIWTLSCYESDSFYWYVGHKYFCPIFVKTSKNDT